MAKSKSKPKSRAPKMKTLTMCASNMCIMVLLLFILFFVLYTQTNIFKNKTIEGYDEKNNKSTCKEKYKKLRHIVEHIKDCMPSGGGDEGEGSDHGGGDGGGAGGNSDNSSGGNSDNSGGGSDESGGQ